MVLLKRLESIRYSKYIIDFLLQEYPRFLRSPIYFKMNKQISIPICENSVLIGMNCPNEISFSGIVNIKVIRGVLQVLGYQITPRSPPTTVSSIKEYYTMKIKCINDETGFGENVIYLKSLNIDSNKIEKMLTKCSKFTHVYLVSRNEDLEDRVNFLRSYDYPVFMKENLINNFFRPSIEFNKDVIEDESWEDVANKVANKNCKVIITGGRQSGKSTMLHYLVNQCLNKWPEILVLDLDPGQNGFSVMGCLNAIKVSRPLLGPNFTLSSKPIRNLFIGDVSVTSCYQLYSDCVRELAKICNQQEYKDIPCFVNTMGFTRGIGVKLLGLIVNEIKPTDIIQLDSSIKNSNYLELISPSFLGENMQRKCYENFSLHWIPSYNKKVKSSRTSYSLEASTKRNIVLMSYFKNTISQGYDLLNADCKILNTANLKIIIQKPSSREFEMKMTLYQKLCCINGNVVALCCQELTENLIRCLGFGIVRGFDAFTNQIYLITPLEQNELDDVRIIQMSSSILLPQNVYTNQVSRVHGPCPYVNLKTPHKYSQRFKKTSSRLKHSSKTDVETEESKTTSSPS